MSKQWIRMIGFLVVASACEAIPGERCDEFFSNGCKYPGMCVEGHEASVCAVGCETRRTGPQLGTPYCKDEAWSPVQVQAQMGSDSAAMGCFCMPPEGGA